MASDLFCCDGMEHNAACETDALPEDKTDTEQVPPDYLNDTWWRRSDKTE